MSAHAEKVGELFFLCHAGEEQFSGYGLTVERGRVKRLVGLLMVDRPHPVSQKWLADLKRKYGRYELHPMTQTGERGILCQMWIADASAVHVKKLPGASAHLLQQSLFPLLAFPPKPQLDVAWDDELRLWKSTFHDEEQDTKSTNSRKRQFPGFALGQVVSTPGALLALEESGQLPQEFLHRHAAGDWGDVDEHDRKANDRAVREGDRILSAYSTKKGTRLWVITEWDRSVSTILLPSEY